MKNSREPIHYLKTINNGTVLSINFVFSVQTVPQGDQTVEEEKILFIGLFKLISNEGMIELEYNNFAILMN